MPTVTINTTTQPSGLSYEWDLYWDIKTAADAQQEYLRLRDKLTSIPEKMRQMEELARKDGFALPVEDYRQTAPAKALKILLANPGKAILIPADHNHDLLWQNTILLTEGLYRRDFDEVADADVMAGEVFEGDGYRWADTPLERLKAAAELLDSGDYLLATGKELGGYFDTLNAIYEADKARQSA